MNGVELKPKEISNLKDLNEQQRILRAEIQQKELELKRNFKEVKEDWSMGKIAGKAFKYGLNSMKHAVTHDVPATKRWPAGKNLISSALRFGAYQASGFAAKKVSNAILSIFRKKR